MSDQPHRFHHDGENHEDVFDDEFEVEDWDMGVADGFRPSQLETGVEDQRQDQREEQLVRLSDDTDSPPVTSVSAHFAPESAHVQMSPSRKSIRKDRNLQQDPFASPQDPHDRIEYPSLSFEPDQDDMLRRSISSVSTRQFASTHSPRLTSGPSHPYGMYHQDTTGRPVSIATTSTIQPPPRHSTSVQPGPQHPYTMYPQGVTEDLDEHDDHITSNPIVPVGFTGLGQSYRRRGPDGEEQDIIGEFGHTEQLPPYSRYPEDGPEKAPLLVPQAPRALHSRAPVAGSDPTMPLMHTVIEPDESTREPQSMSDASTLARTMSHSSRSSALLIPESRRADKTWSEKNWSERRRTRFCGIPFWAFMVVLLVLVFVASVLGGVVGGFVSGSRKHRPPPPKSISSTSLYDASVIPTPTNMVAPTGTWQLQLSTPTEVRNGCLTNPSQAAAWSCSLGGPPAAALGISPLPGTNRTGAYLYYASENELVYYGTQASYMQTNPAPIITVVDTDNPANGPAFYFQQFYDKLVVLQESALSITPTGARIKRDSILNAAWFEQRHMAKSGERPWFCVWNQTFIEGYIYMQQRVADSYGLDGMTSSGTSSATVGSSGSSTVGGGPPAQTPYPDTVSTTLTLASTTATYSGPASQFPSWSASVYQADKLGKFKNILTTLLNSDQRDAEWQNLPAFPYLVKLEERRLPNNPYPPFCQQYQILDNQQYNAVTDAKGQPVIVPLLEQDPSYSASQLNNGVIGSRLTRRGDTAQSCHCQWMSGQ